MAFTANRHVLLAAVEAAFNMEEVLDASLDALEVIDPTPNPTITTIRREVGQATLSPAESGVTRRVGALAFGVELKGNGTTPGTVPPRVGRLLRACGMSEAAVTAPADLLYRVVDDPANGGSLSFTHDIAHDRRVLLKLQIEITTGGATGVAVATITAPGEATYGTGGHAGVEEVGVILTDGTPIVLSDADGNEVCQITPDFSGGNPSTGDKHFLHLRPAGFAYAPVSNQMESVTMALHLPSGSGQSIEHRLTGARGTFTVTSQIGGFPRINFEFTGTYTKQEDVPDVSPIYEDSRPPQVEFAAVALADRYGPKFTQICTNTWTVALGASVNPKDCQNAETATAGAALTAREPTLVFDPEVVLKADYPFWEALEENVSVEWWSRHGTKVGNTWCVHAPNAQLTGISYADRNNIRTFNIDAGLAGVRGDDEIMLVAC